MNKILLRTRNYQTIHTVHVSRLFYLHVFGVIRVPNSVLGNKVRSYPYELSEYLIRGKVHIKHQLSSFVDNDKYFFKRSHKVNFLSFLLPVSPLQSSVWLCTEYMYSTVYLHILKQNIFFLPFSCVVKLIHFKANIWHSG